VTPPRHPDETIPFDEFVSETSAADLLEQVRWRDGRQCPRCRSESVIKYGSYQAFQRYRCTDRDRTFNDKTGTIFACAEIAFIKWLFAIDGFLRFNTGIRQLEAELDVSCRTFR
jgi:transposase-like protein